MEGGGGEKGRKAVEGIRVEVEVFLRSSFHEIEFLRSCLVEHHVEFVARGIQSEEDLGPQEVLEEIRDHCDVCGALDH